MATVSVVLAEGWIPFVVVLLLTVLFSLAYVKYFMSKYDSDCSTMVTAVFGLSVSLITSILVPVDIFLVSYMKNSDGHFKEWANSSSVRESVEQSVLIAYYVLYAITTFCFFLLLPFVYFYFEEKDDAQPATRMARCCGALKYTIVFLLVSAVLLLMGAFLPKRSMRNGNETSWKRVENLFRGLESNDGEDALSFLISVLSLVGMVATITYTAFGMSAMPIGLIKGYRNVSKDRESLAGIRATLSAKIQAIRDKYSGRSSMSSRDRQAISNLEDEERLMTRQDRHLKIQEGSCLRKCLLVLRPFEIIFGVFFLLMALLIFISLLLTNIDKAIYSRGYKFGYSLPTRTLPNPIDIVLVFSQKVFPLDYILIVSIILYFIFCSISGIRNIGIWFFCLRMFKIRPHRTNPQGMLMLCMIMMLIVLAINVVLYEITPQYSSFGSEEYLANTTNVTGNNTASYKLVPCSTEANKDQCVMTQVTVLLTRFFYKMFFFGAAYYWLSWIFLALIPIGFIISVVKQRRSVVDGQVDVDDFEESDDDMLPP